MLSRLYYVCCDVCGIPESEGHVSAKDARAEAKRRGWKRVDGKDRCRPCVAGREAITSA